MVGLDCWAENKDTGGTDWIRKTGLDWKVVFEFVLDVPERVVVATVRGSGWGRVGEFGMKVESSSNYMMTPPSFLIRLVGYSDHFDQEAAESACSSTSLRIFKAWKRL